MKNFKEFIDEAAGISVGKTVSVMLFDPMTNRRLPTDVKIVNYEKIIAGKDMVHFTSKGKALKKWDVGTFKSRMKEASKEK